MCSLPWDGLTFLQIGHDVQFIEVIYEAGRDGAVDERTFPRCLGRAVETWQDKERGQHAQPDQRRG